MSLKGLTSITLHRRVERRNSIYWK